MKYSIEKSIRLGFILVCGLLVCMAGAAYLRNRSAQEALVWSRRSRDTIGQIRLTLLVMEDIETGVRGYLLTGNESYLEPYRTANPQTATSMANLKYLLADDPSQQERLRELQAAVAQMLSESGALIALRRAGNPPAAETRTGLDRGKRAMDSIRAILAGMEQEEREVHARHVQGYTDASGKSLMMLTGLAGVMFGLFVLSYSLLERHLDGRRRAEAALRESEDRMRLVLDSAAEAICGVDRQGLCSFVNRATLKMLGYGDAAHLLGKRLHGVAHHSRADGSAYPIEECPIAQVVDKGLPVHGDNEVFWRADGSSFPVEYWSYPIRRAGEISGAVLTFLDITQRQSAETELREANQKLSRGIEELELHGREIALMSEMVSLLQSCKTPEEAYQVVMQVAGHLFPGAGGALGVISPSRDVVEIVTKWGDPALGEAAFATDACWALRSGRPYRVDGRNAHIRCEHVLGAQAGFTMCVPMMALGESLGILFMSHPAGEEVLASGANVLQENLVVAFAENVGLALANLNLRETLRLQSIRDPLTGLFNRRYMEEFLDRELKRAARNQRTIGVIMFDLDHFKRYNDTFGHEAGDVLLKEAAALVRTLVRGDDMACRYGGEEFLLVMPDATLEITLQRAESLRSAVAHLHVQHQGRPLGTVTVSAGVAIFPEHGTGGPALLRAADQALYRAKQAGRNRVTFADQALSIPQV